MFKTKILYLILISALVMISGMPVFSADISYTVSGYIYPDFTFSPSVSSLVLSGFRVELSGTSINASCDGNGYFELKNVPANTTYTLKISKTAYLPREIKNIKVNGNLQISTALSPVYLWAGDINNDNAVNMSDIMTLAGSFNSIKDDSRFREELDFNKDSSINMSDIMVIAKHFNSTISTYPEHIISSPTPNPTSKPTPTTTSIAPSVTRTEDTLFTYSGLTTVSYGGYLNGESFQQDGITTFNGYQYSAFWNTNKHVVMCRRKLPDGAWSKFEFTDYPLSAADAHNTISIGICPTDGTIHLAFDHHGNDLHYRVSVPGLAANPGNYTWAASNFKGVVSSLAGSTVTLVTYPRFITEPSNKLLFEYRYGSSGSGDQYLYEYDGSTQKWTSLGKYIDGISMNNNAYAHGITYDKNGRLHETWCWRETPDASTNHDLLYIYSDDNGRTWKNNSGTTVAVTGSTFVTSNSPGIKVWTISQNRGLINQEAQAVDNNGQIHVLLSHMRDSEANDSNFTNARIKCYYFHYWRDSSGSWHRNDTGLASIDNFRGKLAFSTSNNIYAVLPNVRIAGASEASNWSNWTTLDMQYSGKFFSDPLIDTSRLKLEPNTLTIFCPAPNSPNIYNITYTLK